jgi:hypothetical protein
MPEGPDKSHYFGGGATETVLNPIVLVAMLITILLILVLPRKYIIVPILIFAFLAPGGQSVYAVGVHWLVLRIVTLVGLLRVLVMKFTSKKSPFAGGLNNIDKAFLICVVAQAIATPLQYMDSQALINQFGILIDFLGGYFLLRALIQDETDVYRTLKCLAVMAVILGLCMVREQVALQNIFGQIGLGRTVPEIREGKIRSQAVFQHSLTAGTFGAVLLPLFFLLWKNGKAKVLAAAGVVGTTIMTICSNSSTPLLAYVAGVLGVCLWPIRKKMKAVRWGIVGALVVLQMFMKAPFWFAIAHIDLTGGSSGYHRAELVDQFITHFRDWWLIGTKDAGTWAYDLWDQQNQYVGVGEGGGLVAFVFFIAMISRSCAKIGIARKAVEGLKREWLFWVLGAAMFANLVAFFGVNYFDQVKVVWFALLAMISATTASVMQEQKLHTSSVDSELSDPHFAASIQDASCEELVLQTPDTAQLSTSVSKHLIGGG